MKDNMQLWNKVCKTDPSHTKKVNQRGGFTAIDAMYQIETATREFGAAGNGWGWTFSDPIFPPNGTVVIKCTLWHGDKSNTVEQYGQKKLGSDDRPDEDAFKKAGTDALTKCLSLLGFNADVFLGKFDDNKYVEELKKEAAKKEEPKKETPQNVYDRFVIAINKIKSMEQLNKFLIRQDIKDAMDKLFLDDKALMDKLDKLIAQKNEDLASVI